MSNFFQCRHGGCRNHGSCVDQQTMKEMFDKTPYEPTVAQVATVCDDPIDFEKKVEKLQQLLTEEKFEEYNTELNLIVQSITKNCQANDPASLRNFLKLQSSNAFVSWADETAKNELAYCNTKLLKQL